MLTRGLEPYGQLRDWKGNLFLVTTGSNTEPGGSVPKKKSNQQFFVVNPTGNFFSKMVFLLSMIAYHTKIEC